MFEIGTLDQFADIIMGQSPKGTSVSQKGEIPLLNGPTEFGINHPTPVQFTSDPKRFAKKGDLLFCVRGSTGRMNWADQDYAIGRGLAAITPKDGISNYFLRGSIEFFLKHLLSGATGSVFTNINKDQLHKMKCYLPDEDNLKKINQLLGNISQKIELNQKMNETLEEIAKTLFKSWFIDFDPVRAKAERRATGLSKEISDLFPDSFEVSELGEIPRDWKVENIESLTSKIAMGPFGSDMKTSTYVEEGIPIISGKQMSGYVLTDQDNNFISPSHAQKLKNSLVQRGDIVITQTGTVGQVSLVPQNSKYSQYIVSSRQHFCRPLEENLKEYLFCFLTSGKGQHEILKNVVTTGVPSISRPVTNLKSIQLVLPEREILKNFSQIVKPIIMKIRFNISINRYLSNIRDFLLPKLISGELKIPDAENLAEEAVI